MAPPRKKKILGLIKLEIPAGKANPAPPVGPALGQRGVNIMEFCKAFNEATSKLEPETPVPVVITVYADRSFTFETRTPPASWYVRRAVGAAKGSPAPHKEKIGVLTRAQAEEIARAKMPDLNAAGLEGAVRMVQGSARSMGVEVE